MEKYLATDEMMRVQILLGLQIEIRPVRALAPPAKRVDQVKLIAFRVRWSLLLEVKLVRALVTLGKR